MAEDEYERYVQRLREAVGVCEAPGEGRQDQEEGEEVGEGGVGAVVCFCCLFLRYVLGRSTKSVPRGYTRVGNAYVVVYLPKDLLRRYDQAHNLPDGHFKVHLRELEEPLEEARHADFIAPRGGGCAEVGGPAGWAWEGDVHGGWDGRRSWR